MPTQTAIFASSNPEAWRYPWTVSPQPSNEHRTTLSVIVPVFNEQDTVLTAIQRVLAKPFVDEVLIIDDGSVDDTAQRLEELTDQRVRILRHNSNRGKGAAIRTAIPYVESETVVVQDADLEYDPADIERLLQPIEDGLADVVYGSRFVSGDSRRVLLYWHSLGNRFLTTLTNMAADINLTDMETCYKVFRTELLRSLVLRENRFGFEPEVTLKVAQARARIYEVGISYSGRTYAEGKKINWKDGVSAVRCIVKYGLAR